MGVWFVLSALWESWNTTQDIIYHTLWKILFTKYWRKFRFNKFPAHSCKYHTAFYDTFPINIAYDILCSLHNIPYYRYLRNNGYSGFPTPCLRKKIWCRVVNFHCHKKCGSFFRFPWLGSIKFPQIIISCFHSNVHVLIHLICCTLCSALHGDMPHIPSTHPSPLRASMGDHGHAC